MRLVDAAPDPVSSFVELVSARIREAARNGPLDVDALANELFCRDEAVAVRRAGKDPYLLGLLEVAMAERLQAGPKGGILDATNVEGRLLDALAEWLERDHDSAWRGYVEELADYVESRPPTVWTPCYAEVRDALERVVHLSPTLSDGREVRPRGYGVDGRGWVVEGNPEVRMRVHGRRCSLRLSPGSAPVFVRVAIAHEEGWRLSRRVRVYSDVESHVDLPGSGTPPYRVIVEGP